MADALESIRFSESKVEEMSSFPEFILLFSGKRKSGKDYITDKLFETWRAESAVIIKISGPIKSHWAKSLNLDLGELLSDSTYKEKYRLQMTKWGEETRKKDYGYFCRAAIDMYNATDKRIWIVSDIRRKTDVKWFTENFPGKCRTIRISCSDKIRAQRGWIFTQGIDDSETECDLDDFGDWDLKINNDDEDLGDILEKISELVK